MSLSFFETTLARQLESGVLLQVWSFSKGSVWLPRLAGLIEALPPGLWAWPCEHNFAGWGSSRTRRFELRNSRLIPSYCPSSRPPIKQRNLRNNLWKKRLRQPWLSHWPRAKPEPASKTNPGGELLEGSQNPWKWGREHPHINKLSFALPSFSFKGRMKSSKTNSRIPCSYIYIYIYI